MNCNLLDDHEKNEAAGSEPSTPSHPDHSIEVFPLGKLAALKGCEVNSGKQKILTYSLEMMRRLSRSYFITTIPSRRALMNECTYCKGDRWDLSAFVESCEITYLPLES